MNAVAVRHAEAQLLSSKPLPMVDVHSSFESLNYSYFNFRSTQYFVENGFYDFHNWFDERAWYPLGRIIGGTIYPGNSSL